MGENLLHQKTHAPGLISVGLSSSYCTCPDLKGAQTKENKGVELSQNAPRTCTSSCTHIPVFTASSFSFSLCFTFSNSDLNLHRCLSIPLTSEKHHTRPSSYTCSASLNLLQPPPHLGNKAIQSSSTIFSHIYSFSLRFVKRLRQFYTVFPSGSAPFSALIVFRPRLYVLKTLNTIAAPPILKN